MNTLLPIFKALSDRNRLRIVAALSDYPELCACQITELLRITGASASRHLAVLVSAGLIESRKDGRWVWYKLIIRGPLPQPALAWVQQELCLDDAIKNDRKALAEIWALGPEELCRRQRGEACCPKKPASVGSKELNENPKSPAP